MNYKWRGWGLGIFYDFYYIGGLLSAGITYGTARLNSTIRSMTLISSSFSEDRSLGTGL